MRDEDLARRPEAMELREKLLAKAGAMNRIHQLDVSHNADEGAWPGWSAFGRKQGESGQAERGGCADHGEAERW